jgi:hypothetical protein
MTLACPKCKQPITVTGPLPAQPQDPALATSEPFPDLDEPPVVPQRGLRVAVVFLAFFGAAVAAAVGYVRYDDIYLRQAEKFRKAEAALGLVKISGKDVSSLEPLMEEGRKQLNAERMLVYLLFAAAVLGVVGSIVADKVGGPFPGLVILAAAGAPALLLPKFIFVTSVLLLAGALALLLRARQAGMKGKRAVDVGAGVLALAVLGTALFVRLHLGRALDTEPPQLRQFQEQGS